MRVHGKLRVQTVVSAMACTAVLSAVYAGTENTPLPGHAREDRPAAGQTVVATRADSKAVALAGAAAAAASTSARAASAPELPTTTADVGGGKPASSASPLPVGIWDATLAGPASTRDQSPTAERDDLQFLPQQRMGVDADGPRLTDAAAQDSWIRSATGYLRENRLEVMMAAAGLLGLVWLLSILVRRNSSTASRRGAHAPSAHNSPKAKRKRIRIRFRIAGPSHGPREEHHHDAVKRDHRHRRRHSRPTTP